MIGNQVAAGINGLNEMIAFIKAGRLRAIAISSEKRVPGVDIPTFKEQGVDVALANWRGVVAAPGITADQRASLTSLVDKMHKAKQWKDVLDMYQSGPAFEKFLKEENGRAQEVLKSIGLVK
jgi:putative tricarboxylic transport membrane protein